MKFISTFESYINSLGTGSQVKKTTDDSGISDMIREYNGKKSILQSIFKGSGDDQKIKSDILSKVYSGDKNSQNKLLNRLENILWMERSISKILDSNKESLARKSDMEKKLRDLEKVNTVADGRLKKEVSNSIITIQSEIKSIDDSIKSGNLKVKEIEDNLKKEKFEFSRFEREIYTKLRDTK